PFVSANGEIEHPEPSETFGSEAPCLLTMPTYGGTLAAVRCLGEHGVRVVVAGEDLLAPARWSRYAARWERCPPVSDGPRFLEWLLEFGDREPGYVLPAPSDDIAYFFAFHAAELGKRFRLYQPDVRTLVRALDKKLLADACQAVGLDAPETWVPKDE